MTTILQCLYKYLFYGYLKRPLNLLVCVLPVDIQQHKGTFNHNISASERWVKTIECQNSGDSFFHLEAQKFTGEMFHLGTKTRWGKWGLRGMNVTLI